MKTMRLPLHLAALFMLTSCAITTRNGSNWQAYTFTGSEIIPAEAGGIKTVWIRDGFMPRGEKPGVQESDLGSLPPKSGAIAGICYIQTSGGKLVDQSGYSLLKDEQITIKSTRDGIFVARTDEQGIFIEPLYPGEYEFSCRGAGRTAVIKEGKTALVQIRGGKRMAD